MFPSWLKHMYSVLSAFTWRLILPAACSRLYEWWQWRGTQHSPKLLHYWNLIIGLFSFISEILVKDTISRSSTFVGEIHLDPRKSIRILHSDPWQKNQFVHKWFHHVLLEICYCIYERYSLMWILLKGLAIRGTVYICFVFLRKSLVMDPFMIKNAVNMTLFNDRRTQNIFFAGGSVYFHFTRLSF